MKFNVELLKMLGLIKTPAPMLDPSVEMARDTSGVFGRHMESIKRKPFLSQNQGHQDRGCDAGRKGKVGFAGLLEVSTLYNG